jgi:hypothetical protein
MTAPEQDRAVWSSWRKSSFSGGTDHGNCVEIAWRKSSFSGANTDCVEMAFAVESVAIRDSKNPDGPRLEFPHARVQSDLLSSLSTPRRRR